VLIEFGEPIVIDAQWVQDYQKDEQATVRRLTEHLAEALINVTLNAPDWQTLRFIQTARRLYKPATADLSPGNYVELSRRFVDGYLQAIEDPELQAFRNDVENYQARLDLLGLKDYQLRQPMTLAHAFRKVILRSATMLALLPIAIPGALLHLPVGWIAATVGERFSYEMDDIATLKVLATILLLPVLYLAIGIIVGIYFGFWWAIVAVVALSLSFFASVRLIEAEAGLLNSMLSILRLARLGSDVDELRAARTTLVTRIRTLADRLADPDVPRMFTDKDFSQPGDD
jgi:glycerol-3-phosphate O-acyltransferase/dihydroxyacetone phosphate acyltransferase